MSSHCWEPRNLRSLFGFIGDFVALAQVGPMLLWWALNPFPSEVFGE